MSDRERNRVSFSESQAVKPRIFSLGEGESLMVETSLASIAFGISQKDFKEMLERGRSLIISPEPDGLVRIGLAPSADDRQRDLWQEMIDSLNRGRSQASLAKSDYVDLAMRFQQGLSMAQEKDDADVLQLKLLALWDQLPEGMRTELDHISPDKVRSAVGIVGGGS